MDRALIEREVAGLLAAMGIRAESLRPDARLLQDLRIEGDDAAEFFAAVAARFGTDLSALHADWDSHFGAEGLPLTAAAPVALASAASGAIAALVGVPGVLCAVPAAIGGAATWLAGRATSAGRLRPIRLSEVADAVERGRWDEHGSAKGGETAARHALARGAGLRARRTGHAAGSHRPASQPGHRSGHAGQRVSRRPAPYPGGRSPVGRVLDRSGSVRPGRARLLAVADHR